ncbi:KIDINS220 [Cordylochernes scorpioides]|uniref:KIDINS220 n=1 Tax=Cordylochernes scorpioides TaxID=51811 RepID=A0ABY6K675_9ARAC|nr:KIDINS220 [Cordylochernes scorpioides]
MRESNFGRSGINDAENLHLEYLLYFGQGQEYRGRPCANNEGVVTHCDVQAGWTGLMWCCYKGHEALAQFLLEHGANPNVADQYNISCLAWAAGRGFATIVHDLLAHGAKVNVGDKVQFIC